MWFHTRIRYHTLVDCSNSEDPALEEGLWYQVMNDDSCIYLRVITGYQSKIEVPRGFRNLESGNSGEMVSTLEQIQVPYEAGPGVRRSKHPLLASRTRCNVLWQSTNVSNRAPKVCQFWHLDVNRVKAILQVLIYKAVYDKSYLGSKTTMTSGEWTCLISFATASLTCSERGGSEKFKMKIYVSSGIRTHIPPVHDRKVAAP